MKFAKAFAVVSAFSSAFVGTATSTFRTGQDISEALQQATLLTEQVSSQVPNDSAENFLVPLRQPDAAGTLPQSDEQAPVPQGNEEAPVASAPDAALPPPTDDASPASPANDAEPAETEQESYDTQAVSKQATAVAAVKHTELLLAQSTGRYNNERQGHSSRSKSFVQRHSFKKGVDIKSTRPSHLIGKPDIVSFGVFAKGFFGADLKNNKFTVDSVMALKWTDPRVAALVPAGTESLSMSGKMAMKKIWMPEVIITNRDIKKYDLISTSVTVFATGVVTKVERAGVVINQMYELEEYPFDEQKLHIKVASGKYMLSEVELAPDEDKSSSGARDGLMSGTPYNLKSWRVFSFKETDGALKKSRGVLELTVERTFDSYRENHLMSACLLLALSWAVFWFPFENPFVTPRLALSILALLAFTNLMIKSSAALPEGSPSNWNDSLNQQIQAMMFCTIVINILSETYKHQIKVEKLAYTINNEAKVLLPALGITVVFIAMASGGWGLMSIGAVGILTKLLIGVVMASYIASCMSRLGPAQAEQAAAKAAKEEGDKMKELQKLQAEAQRLAPPEPQPQAPTQQV